MLKEIDNIENEFEVEIQCIGLIANNIENAEYFVVRDSRINRAYKVKRLGDIRIKIISERLDHNLNKYLLINK